MKRDKDPNVTLFDLRDRFGGDCTLSPLLLWEYDLSNFDWWRSRKIVVQRVIERGWPKDFFAAFDLYGGKEGFCQVVKELPYLSDKDMNFVCAVFGLKKEELKCYTRKQLRAQLLGC